MKNETLTIIILIAIIIGLVWIIFAGRSSTEIALESLRGERDTALESNRIMAIENERIRKESNGLREDNRKSADYNKQLEYQNNEYKQLIDDIRTVTGETKEVVSEYGRINNDFAELLRQATITD